MIGGRAVMLIIYCAESRILPHCEVEGSQSTTLYFACTELCCGVLCWIVYCVVTMACPVLRLLCCIYIRGVQRGAIVDAGREEYTRYGLLA
jgi:hypothetical protein